jgi:hypothetical protein
MFTTIALLAALIPQSQPIAVPAGSPAIVADVPTWAFASMSLPDEPTLPCLPEWADWTVEVRTEALMASVSPFDLVDGADPFDGDDQ